MAKLKTSPTKTSVRTFLAGIKPEARKKECLQLAELMTELTGELPRMWGKTIVGFGSYHYIYESGREGDWFLTGFSPRKQVLTVYIMSGFEPLKDTMKSLGKYKTGSSCLYIKSLEDIDHHLLKKMIRKSIALMKKRYQSS